MLGGSCSPCCAGLPHVGLAMSGWGATFHGWNTVSTSYSTTLFGSTWHTIESYLADNTWTVLGERYDPYRSLTPYAQFGSFSYFFGPQWSTVRAYRTLSAIQIELVLFQRLLLPRANQVGYKILPNFFSVAVTSTILYEKPLANFWEGKLDNGTFIFNKADVISFSSVVTPHNLLPNTDGLAALQEDVGSLAIIQRPDTLHNGSWTKPLSFPVELIVESEETNYSVPINCSNDVDTFFFHAGSGVAIQAVASDALCFNQNTTQVVSANIAMPPSLFLPAPANSQQQGLAGKPSGTAILFLLNGGGATIWKLLTNQQGSAICNGRTLITYGGCSEPSFLQQLPAAGCAVHQAYWEAFSSNGSVTIPCNGRNVVSNPFPGSTFGYAQPGFNTDATFTVRMI